MEVHLRRTPLVYTRLEPSTPGGSVTTTKACANLLRLVAAWEACQASWDAAYRRTRDHGLDHAMTETFTSVMEENLALAASILSRLEASSWRSNYWRTTLNRVQAARQRAA